MRSTEIEGGSHGRLIKIGKGEDPCWEWLGGCNGDGRPRKRWMGLEISARRWLYLLLFGRIPKGFVLKDRCNNRMCVNPSHCKPVRMADAQRAGEATQLVQSEVLEWREQLKHPEAGRRKFLSALISRAMDEANVPRRTIQYALGNYTFHDPKLPQGIHNIIRYHKENPPPCASTSSSSNSLMVGDTSQKSASPTPISRPRSRRPRRAPAPPATRCSPSRPKSASQSNGER